MSTSLMIWMGTLTVSICAVILSAAAGAPEIFMAVTAIISLFIALFAISQLRSLEAEGGSQSALAAASARFMGLVWTWGALALLVSYYFILEWWREWWHFLLAFAFVAVLSLFFASTMQRDADAKRDDKTLLKLGRYLTIAQLVGTIAAVAGLLIDPDKQFLNAERLDWAATNIFFFGALALAAISAYALMNTRVPQD